MAPVIHQLSQTIPPDSTSSAFIPGSSGPRVTEVLIRESTVSSSGNSVTFTPPASYAFTDDTDSDTSDTSSSSNSSRNSSSSKESGSGISGPLKGAIAGSILGAAFLLLLLYCCYRRSPRAAEEHRRKHRKDSNTLKDSPEPAPEPAPEPKPEPEPTEPPPASKKKKTVRIAPGSTPPPQFTLHPHVRTPVKVKVKLYPDSEEAKGMFSPIERYTMDLGAGAHIRIKRSKSGPSTVFVSRPRDPGEVV
ncbi:hypothetical protein PENANT_c035G08977 [Penicillium antarcticum]|uniref:Uncharacterized protein n=1 Tax=Penicillium antarcticum TaxID=416450 RepID=A0A1V6PUR4_9EURO|nr:hypothetical protein PENANT_c035G08977 [Penicillium antarcticum]